MPSAERKFIHGMIRYFKPNRILELGVCDGGGSIVIMNAISDMPDTELVSVDILTMAKTNSLLPVGHAALSKYPDSKNWDLYVGKEPSEIMDSIGSHGNFDFAVIDTLHIHPGETLNFLTILPYLSDNAIVIVQDISLYSMFVGFHGSWTAPLNLFPKANLAARLLFDTVVGDKITLPVSAYIGDDMVNWDVIFSNIGAIQINSDTKKYIGNLFSILEFPWGVVPARIAAVSQFIQRHYQKQLHDKFQYAFRKNTRLVNNKGVLYHYDNKEIDFAPYRKVIFYGCGQCAKDYFRNIENIPVIPDEIWDNNAVEINKGDIAFLECIPVCDPKLGVADKDSIAVVLTLYDADVKKEVKSLLEVNGFTSIFDYSECY